MKPEIVAKDQVRFLWELDLERVAIALERIAPVLERIAEVMEVNNEQQE